MKCDVITCSLCDDCGFLDIINKMPKNKYSFSYYRSNAKPKKSTDKIYIPKKSKK